MIVQDNTDIQKQVKKLTHTLEEAVECIRHLDKLADARYEEVDTVDEVANFDSIIFNMRAVMFNAKIELEKIQKAMHKHVAHTLNPIARTAPKSAKKGRGDAAYGDSNRKHQYVDNKVIPIHNDLDRVVGMNDIMPGKDGHHPAKPKHITISRGNAPKNNPAHESDKPF